jgi:hypothetical protein
MRLYFNSQTEPAPQVIDGDPPDAAMLAQLQAQVAALTAENAKFKTFRNAVVADAQARKAADTATNDGQNLLDAASGLPA